MMKLSPLFWPVKLKGNVIFVLDETLLPAKVRYIEARDYQDSCRAIKEMKTRAVGQVLLVLYTFLLVVKKNKSRKDILPVLKKVSDSINSTRPTLSFKYLTDMVLGWAGTGAPLEKNILGFLEMLKAKRIQQAEKAAELVNDGDVVLTHCNVSGLMPLIGEFAKRRNKILRFYATETRPYLQGARLTSWELKRMGFEVTIIADNMVAQVMAEGRIDKVILGADNLAQNGDIANKVGTLQIAVSAKHFGIPFYVLCPPESGAKTGKDIKIEVRPDRELLVFEGVRFAPQGVKGYYPAFDVTPYDLVTKHIYLEIEK